MLLEAIQKEKKQIQSLAKREGKMEIAKLMLQNGEPLAQVMRYTGLDKTTLLKIQNGRRN
jgi:hypothetical protein